MADPGAKLVVFGCIEQLNSRSDLLEPGNVFLRHSRFNVLTGRRSNKPHGALEEIRIGRFDSRVFLAGHWMTGKKVLRGPRSEYLLRMRDDCRFCASDIRQERVRGKTWTEFCDELKDSAYRGCQNNDVTSDGRFNRIGSPLIDSFEPFCTSQHFRLVAADDLSLKFIFAESEAERSANKACADDRDLANHRRIKSFKH